MKRIYTLIFVTFLCACSSGYYSITNSENIAFVDKPAESAKLIDTIPAGTIYLSMQENKRFRKVKYGQKKGYILNPYYDNPYYETKFEKQEKQKQYEIRLAKIKSSYVDVENDSSNTSDTPPSYSDDRDKTVKVKGYYRKNGTYVQPYNRRPPSRK